MTDKELADKVVALGVGRYWPEASPEPRYDMANGCMFSTSEAPEFLRDWRVAGALMERLNDFLFERSGSLLGLSTRYKTPQPGRF